MSLVSKNKIGLEIECPFSFYFPTLWEKYFQNGSKKYYEFSVEEKENFSREIKVLEPEVLRNLEEVTRELNLKRGKDRYWEFVLPADNDLGISVSIVKYLIERNLLPKDIPLSVHLNVGDIKSEHAFAVLYFLEKNYLTKSRIEEGFNKDSSAESSWKRKGGVGILTKDTYNSDLFYGDKKVQELRILKIKMQDMEQVLLLCKELLDSPESEIISEAKREVESMGLIWNKKWDQEDFATFGNNLGR
jgi:hypothetical protein